MRQICGVIAAELTDLEDYLRECVADQDPVVGQMIERLLHAGGKRLRPALVLLGAQFGSFDYHAARPVAAAAELIHMATLVHDDIIDEAPLRRGSPTVSALHGDWVAVLAGDFLFARAFELLGSTGDVRVVQAMAGVVRVMCQGEIAQNVAARGQDPPSEDAYLDRIGRKTAVFIAESLRCGALIAGADARDQDALYRFGYNLGLSFQITDDVLDLTAGEVGFGKAIGTDLKAGVITLPVIHALQSSPRRVRLHDLATHRDVAASEVEEVRSILGEAGSFGYTEALADRLIDEAKVALAALQEGRARRTLLDMAEFVVERRI